jgi:DNA-binding beta-propeller fold protein YncE
MKSTHTKIALLIAGLCMAAAAAQETSPLTLVGHVPLPGVTGRFDHCAIDLQRHLFFVPDEEDHKVSVIDLDRQAVVHNLEGFVKPHSIYYRPDSKEFLVSDDDGTYKVFDAKSFKLKLNEHLKLNYSDGTRFDPSTKYLYIVNVRKGSEDPEGDSYLAVIDTRTWKHIDDIPFKGGHVEEVALEKSGPRLFIAIASRKAIAIVDRKKKAEIGAWPLPIPGLPYAVVMDEANHRLFVALRKPEQLLVLDSDTGKLVSTLPTAPGADDIFYDPTHRRIYVSAGVGNDPEGYVSVYRQLDADHYEQISKVATGASSATSLFVPQLDRYFVPAQRKQEKDAELQVYKINP